jgi:hypothetical protein
VFLLACVTPEPEPTPPSACNGSEALCDLPFDQVVLPGTHNSMSNEADDFSLPNQPTSLTDQYDDGIRALLLDTYEWEGDLWLCHGYCELGALPLVDALTDLADFLRTHPGEVMAIIFEDYITGEQTEGAFDNAGLTGLTYTWDGGSWPTLGEMVAADTRLFVTAESGGPPPDWYQPAWELYRDTPYDYASVAEMDCASNRGTSDSPLFLLNHWAEDPFPDPDLAAEANSYDVLEARVNACADVFGQLPNIVAVDWYTEGDLFAVIDAVQER